MDYETTVGQIEEAVRRYRKADNDRILAAMHGGRWLLDAKAMIQHKTIGQPLNAIAARG